MNFPVTSRRAQPGITVPVPRSDTPDPENTLSSAEDIIGDLDPGWLEWRREQSGR